jgi:hypothetical protein
LHFLGSVAFQADLLRAASAGVFHFQYLQRVVGESFTTEGTEDHGGKRAGLMRPYFRGRARKVKGKFNGNVNCGGQECPPHTRASGDAQALQVAAQLVWGLHLDYLHAEAGGALEV